MISRKRKLIVITVLLAIIGGPIWAMTWLYATIREDNGISIGEKFPPLSLKTLEGDNVTLGEHVGKKLLLIFFSVECPRCEKELANLERIYQDYDSDQFEIIAISEDDRETLGLFLGEHPFPYPVLMDTTDLFKTKLGGRRIPCLFLVDEHGILRYRRKGYRSFPTDNLLISEFVAHSKVPTGERIHAGVP